MYVTDEILNGIVSLPKDASFEEFEEIIHAVVDNMIVDSLGIDMKEYDQDRTLTTSSNEVYPFSVSDNLADMNQFNSELDVINRLSRFSTYPFKAYDIVTAVLTYPHRNYVYGLLVTQVFTHTVLKMRPSRTEEVYSIDNSIRLMFKDELSNDEKQAVTNKMFDLIQYYSNEPDYPKFSTHTVVTLGLLINSDQVDAEQMAKLILKHVHVEMNENTIKPSIYQDECTKLFFNIIKPYDSDFENTGNTVAAYIRDSFKNEGKLYKMFKLLNVNASNCYDMRYKSSMRQQANTL